MLRMRQPVASREHWNRVANCRKAATSMPANASAEMKRPGISNSAATLLQSSSVGSSPQLMDPSSTEATRICAISWAKVNRRRV